MIRSRVLKELLFLALRVYVFIERPVRAFAKWWRGDRPDIVLEPLTLPEGEIPEVHDATPVFLATDGDVAYAPAANGKTLRRVAVNDEGELVYVGKIPKRERRALKRAKGRNDHHTPTAARA